MNLPTTLEAVLILTIVFVPGVIFGQLIQRAVAHFLAMPMRGTSSQSWHPDSFCISSYFLSQPDISWIGISPELWMITGSSRIFGLSSQSFCMWISADDISRIEYLDGGTAENDPEE